MRSAGVHPDVITDRVVPEVGMLEPALRVDVEGAGLLLFLVGGQTSTFGLSNWLESQNNWNHTLFWRPATIQGGCPPVGAPGALGHNPPFHHGTRKGTLPASLSWTQVT